MDEQDLAVSQHSVVSQDSLICQNLAVADLATLGANLGQTTPADALSSADNCFFIALTIAASTSCAGARTIESRQSWKIRREKRPIHHFAQWSPIC